MKQQQLEVDALQHTSVKLEEENAFWKQKADEEEHIKKGEIIHPQFNMRKAIVINTIQSWSDS